MCLFTLRCKITLITKLIKDILRKENYRLISLQSIDGKPLNKMLARKSNIVLKKNIQFTVGVYPRM